MFPVDVEAVILVLCCINRLYFYKIIYTITKIKLGILQIIMKTYFFVWILLISGLLTLGHTFNIRPQAKVVSSGQYNATLSKDYAILAVTSYCDRKCVQNWTCQITKNYLKDDKITNVTHLMGIVTRAGGFVAYDHTKNLIVVSLRGSANAQNWISDFTFETVSYSKCKDCRVHVGFLEDYHSVQVKLHQAVDNLVKAYPNAQILATGHSMGAALSVIVGLQLKLRHNIVVEIHNIGCPRVGNANYARFVQNKVDRVNRVVHDRDLIVHLPPPQFGYHHSAHEIFWDDPMSEYVVCNESGEDKSCSNKYSPHFKGSDHDFYFWDLNKILKC